VLHIFLVFRAEELCAFYFIRFGGEDQENCGGNRKDSRCYRKMFEEDAPRQQK
jgi:hypothetical protein